MTTASIDAGVGPPEHEMRISTSVRSVRLSAQTSTSADRRIDRAYPHIDQGISGQMRRAAYFVRRPHLEVDLRVDRLEIFPLSLMTYVAGHIVYRDRAERYLVLVLRILRRGAACI